MRKRRVVLVGAVLLGLVGLGLGVAAWLRPTADMPFDPALDLARAEARLVPKRVISGPVSRVVDGDTFVLAGQRVRLFGVDAPERDQRCERGGRTYNCGAEATRWLEAAVAGRDLSCAQRDIDHFDRMIGVCRAGDVDLGEALVRAGWAYADRRFSLAYVEQEGEARQQRRGAWAGRFEDPAGQRAR